MTDSNKPNHWKSLADDLGADVHEPAPKPAVVPPRPVEKKREAVPPPKRTSDWSAVNLALGLEAPPPPAKPAPVVKPVEAEAAPPEGARPEAAPSERVRPRTADRVRSEDEPRRERPSHRSRRGPKDLGSYEGRYGEETADEVVREAGALDEEVSAEPAPSAPDEPSDEKQGSAGSPDGRKRRRRRRGRRSRDRGDRDDRPATGAAPEAGRDDDQRDDDKADADESKAEGESSFADARFEDAETVDLEPPTRNDAPRPRAADREAGEDDQRRRRRRRRRRGPKPTDSVAAESTAEGSPAFDASEPFDVPVPFDPSEPVDDLEDWVADVRHSDDEADDDRPSNGRQRETTREDLLPDESTAESANSEAAHDGDAADDDVDDDIESHHGHRGIPTWEEGLGYIIAANLEARAKNPHSGPPPRRGRGQWGRGKPRN